jgi:chemotaxis protein methyltransferase CheR
MNEPLATRVSAEHILRPADFERIRSMTYDFCGLNLEGKQALVESRLVSRVRELSLPSFHQYCDYVQQEPTGSAFTAMIDALTTNHTGFFREARHFEFLCETVLPDVPLDRPICIWSAACSSGEEPYTIAFSVLACLGTQAYDRLAITATDISTRVLRTAATGVYPVSSLKSLPGEMLRTCLLKGSGSYAGHCMVKSEIRKLVQFHQLNLLEDCSFLGPFHVIFCRNVMIYFDQQTQQGVVDRLVSRLHPGGYLFIGHAESLNHIDHPLKYISSAIYRKAGGFSDGHSAHTFPPPNGRRS